MSRIFEKYFRYVVNICRIFDKYLSNICQIFDNDNVGLHSIYLQFKNLYFCK